MPPKNTNWSAEQIAFVMEQSAAGAKPAKIGEEVKERWPDQKIAKGAISSLISRQNKKKATTQGKGQSSRETSTAPSVSARSEVGEPSFAPSASARSESHNPFKPAVSSPSVSETPQSPPRPTTPTQKIVTPNASPKIPPFSSFQTPPRSSFSFPASEANKENPFKAESGRRPHKENDSNVSAPRELPNLADTFHQQNGRSSAAQLLERMVSLSPGEGGTGANFLRASESPDKSNPSPELPVLSIDSMAMKGLIKDYGPSLFSKATRSAAPALGAARSSSEDYFNCMSKNQLGGSSSTGASQPTLYSPRPRPRPATEVELKELFPAFDNEAANRFLDDITPAPSTAILDPEIADSFFQDDSASQTNQQEEIVETTISTEAKNEVAVAEEIETEVETAEPAQEVETDPAEPVRTNQQLNSSPVHSPPQSTTPDLDITPRASQLNPPAINIKPLQAAIWSTPAPVKMPNFFTVLGSEIIFLFVGPKRKEFPIHGNLLRLKSSYFKDFVFAVTDTGKTEHYLPEADPDAIGIIIDWLYRQGIEVIPGTLASGLLKKDTDNHTTFTKAISRGIEVYILSAKLGMVELQDLVMTELGKAYYLHQTFPSSKDIATVYHRTESSSRLRKYMARSYQVLADFEDGEVEAVGWTAEEVDQVVSEAPALFKDFRALNRKSKGLESTESSLDLVCSFHAHGVDDECVSKGLNFRSLTS